MKLEKYISVNIKSFNQKQPSNGVFRKRCSENMQQIYRRTPVAVVSQYKENNCLKSCAINWQLNF